MDDSASDDMINVVTSDEDGDALLVINSDDAGDVAVVHSDGTQSDGDHESVGSDEVVVVEENAVHVVEDSDDPHENQTSEEEDRGQPGQAVLRDDSSTSPPLWIPASPLPLLPSLPSPPLLPPPPPPPPQDSQPYNAATAVGPLSGLVASQDDPISSTSTSHAGPFPGTSTSQDGPFPGTSTSHAGPFPGTSTSQDGPFPGTSTSHAGPFPGTSTSHAGPFPGTSTSHAGPFPGTSTSQAGPFPGTSTSHAGPFPGTSTSQDGPFPGTSTSQDGPFPGTSTSQASPFSGTSTSHGRNIVNSMDSWLSPAAHQSLPPPMVAAAASDQSILEFRSPKRRRIASPVKANKGEGASATAGGGGGGGADSNDDKEEEDEDEDGNCCSICFEPWDNSGRHRLASLKCGHLFGLGCIEKWLRGQGGKCPTCNEKAKSKDIRVIYAKAIKMVDTTERDRALQEVEKERELRRRAELEAAQVRLQCQQCMEESRQLHDEVNRLRGELTGYRSQRGGGPPLSQATCSQVAPSQQLHGQFVHDKTIKIWEGGQCRVLAHCSALAALVISQPSANHLFPGFGIKKLSCMDYKTSSYLTLHQKALRGLSFHQTVDDGVLLSVSMDKTVKLTSIITSSVMQTYHVTHPLWSCEWNADNQNYFYVGQQNGTVLEFDTRSTAAHLRELNAEGSKSPVVALQYLSRDVNAPFRPGGLIVGQLDRVSFFESKGDNESKLHILPLEGNLTSLNVDGRTRHLLASFRPSAKYPSVRHQLCELTSTASGAIGDSVVSCNMVHTFHGGRSQSVLGRTMLLPHPADHTRLMVVAGDEQTESAHLWDTGTSQLLQRLPCQGVPVDFSAFQHNSNTYLAALTDRCLKLHRWN